MIGLLPASGRSERLNGIPKFLLPTYTGELLIQYHVRLMRPFVDEIRICTRDRWFGLMLELVPAIRLYRLEPSSMNAALKVIAGDDNLIGMPDTFFTGSNPYEGLAAVNESVGIAIWGCSDDLRGSVGQVDFQDGQILDVRDKDSACTYPFMWGALRLDAAAIASLDPENPHPGYDLLDLIDSRRYGVTVQTGHYIDAGNPAGLHNMLDWGKKTLCLQGVF